MFQRQPPGGVLQFIPGIRGKRGEKGDKGDKGDQGEPGDVSEWQDQLDGKADLVGGVVPSAQIPAVALVTVTPVANRAEMLALTAQPGDVAVIAADDDGERHTYMLGAAPASTYGNWLEIDGPAAAVSSVNGQTGVIVLGPADVGAAPTSHTHAQSDITGLAAALAAKQDSSTAATDAELAAHEADTTSVHGIADTSLLVSRAIVDAKGDLLVGSAADTLARLPVGANDLVLTADSAEATGTKWAAPKPSFYTPTLSNRTSGTTETILAQFTLPAGTLTVDQVLALYLSGQPASGNAHTLRVRCGPLGTVADALVMSFAAISGGVATDTSELRGALRCTATGVSGTVIGTGMVLTPTGQEMATVAASTGTVDTTVQNKVTVSGQVSTATNFTTRIATLNRSA